MKKLFFIILLSLLFACTPQKLEIPKAKEVCEGLINAMDKQEYDIISKFYTYNFNKSESLESRIEKYKQLKMNIGDLVNYTLVDSLSEAKIAEQRVVTLKYKVQYTNANISQTFTVVKDEGAYRISGHLINTAE